MWAIIFSIVIPLLILYIIYKNVFKRRNSKVEDRYSPFDEMTTGTLPTMDGRNPIAQTKEKMQQETKFDEKTEQTDALIEEIDEEIKKNKDAQ